MNRKKIFAQFPWLTEHGHKMICGVDLDAFLSAQLLHHLLGWKIVGYYDFNNIYLTSGIDREDVLKPVYVDLDINRNDVKSIGHHIVYALPCENLTHVNPNLILEIGEDSFRLKYPLGTIHFLVWLYNTALPMTEESNLLFWLPDSAWINAQPHRFPGNVQNWIFEIMPLKMLQRSFGEISKISFEDRMEQLCRELSQKTGFPYGDTQSRSFRKRLRGIQCHAEIYDDKSLPKVRKLFGFTHHVFDWEIPEVREITQTINGSRFRAENNFRYILSRKRPFSYAFTNAEKMNYTIFENIQGY